MIEVKRDKANKLNGEESLFVSFPYDVRIVNVMRSFNKKWYHPDIATWEIPYNEEVLQVLKKELGIELTQTVTEPSSTTLNQLSPAWEGITIPNEFEFVTEPFKHQVDGMKFGLHKDRFLLADEQGLGKTKQVIDIAVAKKQTKEYKHCLIICGVNGLKWNWEEEVGKHSNEKAMILGTRVNSKGKEVIPSSEEKLVDLENLDENSPYFLITNIETLRHYTTVETKKGKKKTVFPIKDLISALCEKGIIGMVAVDEIHKCKNPNSQQGKALLSIKPETRIAITGTPLMNNPMDIFIILKWLGYEEHSFYQFKKHYCIMGGFGGYQIVGYKHLPDLQEELDEIMIRRLKKDVLDLPDKIHSTEYLEMNDKQWKIYNQVEEEIREDIDRIKVSPNPLAQLIRLRQATADTSILSSTINESAKLKRLDELVQEIVDRGEKVIVFSNWTSVTNPAYEKLKRFSPAIITGETKDRKGEQDRFTNDINCKCIIGSLGAMGTGLTLTAASTVIFLDSPWNRALKDQAEDRAHRIGTKYPVNVITLVCKDTIDERIEEIINKKGKMSDILVDNEADFTPEMLDYLLS